VGLGLGDGIGRNGIGRNAAEPPYIGYIWHNMGALKIF